MKKYTEIQKLSKKNQKAYYSRFRKTWGSTDPVGHIIPNKKKTAKETGFYG